MNNLSDLKHKILESFQDNKIDILISLKAFLTDQEECPWILLDKIDDFQYGIISMQNQTLTYFKNYNYNNLKKIQVSSIEIFIMPKNKRMILVNCIDSLLEDIIAEKIFIQDKVRSNPFEKDSLFIAITKNKNFIDSEIYQIYAKRSEDLNKLKNYAEIDNKIYKNCLLQTKHNKIKDYWKNMWGESKNYSLENSLVDNILL